MSINAMKQAIEAINEAVAFREGGRQKAIDAINALRTAIQQAESEPVAFGIRESNKGRICQFVSSDDEDEVAQLGEYRKGIVVPLYTHPAPGVPDDVARDAERYRWLRKSLAAGQGSITVVMDDRRNGRFQKPLIMGELDASIDDAMLAASPAQKGGE